MLTFTEFNTAICEKLQKELGAAHTVTCKEATVDTSSAYSICITDIERRTYPEVFLNLYYHRYQNGDVDIQDIMKELAQVYIPYKIPRDLVTLKATNWKFTKYRIMMRLVNRVENQIKIALSPHRPFLDLEILYVIEGDEDPDYPVVLWLTNQHMAYFGITENDIWEAAKENMRMAYPTQVMNMEEELKELAKEYSNPTYTSEYIDRVVQCNTEYTFYEITNHQEYYGSSVILYTTVLSELSDRLLTDLVLLPVSVHEWYAAPKLANIDFDALKQMLKGMNGQQLEPEYILSDNVYLYDRETGMISIV